MKTNGDNTAEVRAMLAEMVAEAHELKSAAGGSVTDAVAGWLAPQYMLAAQKKLTATDGAGRFEVLRVFMQDWAMLRRGDHYAERLQIEKERLEVTRQLTKEKKELEFEAWLKRPDVQERVRPRVTRERVRRRLMNLLDNAMLGEPLEDFECFDDEELEPPQDPAAMI